jgi:hypothetical protein
LAGETYRDIWRLKSLYLTTAIKYNGNASETEDAAPPELRMPIDQNEFFRQAVIRICGSLEIERAMLSCMEYLAGFIPVTKMEITFFDRSLGVLKTFASVPAVRAGRRPLPPFPCPRMRLN